MSFFSSKERQGPTNADPEDTATLRRQVRRRGQPADGETTPPAHNPPVASNKWRGRLIFVNDTMADMMLARLLADDSTRGALLADPAVESLHDALVPRQMPTDINRALFMHCLLHLSDKNIALPLVGDRPLELATPARVSGSAIGINRDKDDMLFRLASESSATPTVVRIHGVRALGWMPSDLKGHTIRAAGLVRRPQLRHIDAAAIMLVERAE